MSGQGQSEVKLVDLTSGDDEERLRLVVSPTREVRGKVLTAQGDGVAEAGVDFNVPDPTPLSTFAITAGDGSFRVDLPREAARAVVKVVAPAHVLWSGCVRIADSELVLRLPGEGGTLSVVSEASPETPPLLGGETVVFTGDGGYLERASLSNWARRMGGHDGRADGVTRAPAVAPGVYAIAWSTAPPWELARAACAGAHAAMKTVTLLPGGEATVSIDLTPHRRQAAGGDP